MKGLPILFTALAEADLDQIEDYISAHDPAAAARVRATTVQQGLQCSGGPDVVAMRSNLLANTDAGCPKGNGNFDGSLDRCGVDIFDKGACLDHHPVTYVDLLQLPTGCGCQKEPNTHNHESDTQIEPLRRRTGGCAGVRGNRHTRRSHQPRIGKLLFLHDFAIC